MAFDGNFTGLIARELETAIDSHIDKIYQPSSDEIIILLRKKGFAQRLMISVKSGMSRVHFTAMKPENPEKPPMFCMLFRKFFSGARLIKVAQKGFERLIELYFEATNELGDRVSRRIVVELIGNSSNIILVDEKGRIIDAVKRSDILSKKRLVQPGANYTYPESQEKIDIKAAGVEPLIERIKAAGELLLSKAILASAGGISPLVAGEIVYRTGLGDIAVGDIADFSVLKEELSYYREHLISDPVPFMLLRDETPVDFSYFEITQFNGLYKTKTFDSFSDLLDAFYSERAKKTEQSRITGEVSRFVNNLIIRAEKRLNNRLKELKDCESREDLRIKGELIKANISSIVPGAAFVTVQNFYDEDLSDITIKLDPSLNAQNNAARYFKEYKKKSIAAATLGDLIESDKNEKEYLGTVLDNLSRCESTADLKEIKDELSLSGYIRQSRKDTRSKKATANYLEYKSEEGFKILVGKNNIQNDYITTKLASKNDLWFHTKNIHGSHVVVFSGGADVSDETVVFAARLAAKNSKGANSSNVPVDYTRIKYVKKPSGAKPGMVIYTDYNTVFVTP